MAPGKKLAALLKKRKLTIYRAAKDTGLSTGHLHDLTTGKYRPGWDTLQKLASGLGMTLDDLAKRLS